MSLHHPRCARGCGVVQQEACCVDMTILGSTEQSRYSTLPLLVILWMPLLQPCFILGIVFSLDYLDLIKLIQKDTEA